MIVEVGRLNILLGEILEIKGNVIQELSYPYIVAFVMILKVVCL